MAARQLVVSHSVVSNRPATSHAVQGAMAGPPVASSGDLGSEARTSTKGSKPSTSRNHLTPALNTFKLSTEMFESGMVLLWVI